MHLSYSVVQKQVIDRVLVWFLGLVDLQQHITIGIKAISAVSNISATHAFDYIVLKLKFGLTSCEELAMPLYAIDGADVNELEAIASSPEFVFFTSSFSNTGLQQLQEVLQQLICDYKYLYT